MDLIKPLLPTIRVWIFGAVVWLLARLGLAAEAAGPVTDWLMQGIVLAVGLAYGAWAAWRESRARLVARTAALPEVREIRADLSLAAAVPDPKVTV